MTGEDIIDISGHASIESLEKRFKFYDAIREVCKERDALMDAVLKHWPQRCSDCSTCWCGFCHAYVSKDTETGREHAPDCIVKLIS